MNFEPTTIDGVHLVTPQPRRDERGHFARIYCQQELARRGLAATVSQANTAFNPRAGTLRGMHFQAAPHAEVKIVRCVRGAVFDVIVDLRPRSPTYRAWFGAELSADNGCMLYAPEGTAHGYLTLVDDTELMYFTSRAYAPEAASGVHHADPALGIRWPAPIHLVSQADQAWPMLPP
jgi:dTDP-4-dehydrorhamnose 3,5-epimerase